MAEREETPHDAEGAPAEAAAEGGAAAPQAAADPGANPADDFSAQAELPQPGLLGEFWLFLRYNKKWWLTPIILVLLAIGALVVLSGSALAPLLYPFY